MSDGVELTLFNIPHDAEETHVQTVAFGPATGLFTLLVEVDPEDGSMVVTLGNGPADQDVPNVIPAVLREIADIVEDLGERPEYWASISDSN